LIFWIRATTRSKWLIWTGFLIFNMVELGDIYREHVTKLVSTRQWKRIEWKLPTRVACSWNETWRMSETRTRMWKLAGSGMKLAKSTRNENVWMLHCECCVCVSLRHGIGGEGDRKASLLITAWTPTFMFNDMKCFPPSLPPSLRTPRFPPAQTPGVGSKCTGKTISCSMLALNALMTTGTTDDSSRALLQSSQSTIQLVSRVGNYTTTDKSTLFNQKRNSKSVLAQKYY